MIEAIDLHKIFNDGEPNAYQALRGVSLTIPRHSVTLLTGPSGSGKTTLLALVGGMSRPSSGRIFVNGEEITSLPERFLTRLRRRSYGFVFQSFNLVRGLSVLENVMLPGYPTGRPHAELQAAARQLLSRFALLPRAEARVEWLSGGEMQRVAIARALVNDPETIIADEPTAHLDTALSAEFMAMISELHAEGRTVIVASHDPRVTEHTVVTQRISLRDGMVVAPLS